MKTEIVKNGLGGWSIKLPADTLIGNYPTAFNAIRIADHNGFDTGSVDKNESESDLKTAREWFKLLPEDIEKMALENLYAIHDETDNFSSLAGALLICVQWNGSKQGLNFWKRIWEAALGGEYDK